MVPLAVSLADDCPLPPPLGPHHTWAGWCLCHVLTRAKEALESSQWRGPKSLS
jgi:hypothetical protein